MTTPETVERRLPITAAQLAMVQRLDALAHDATSRLQTCIATLLAGHDLTEAQIVGTDPDPSPVLVVRVPAVRRGPATRPRAPRPAPSRQETET